MTLQSSGQIAVSDISTEIGQAPTYSTDLNFLNNLITPGQRPSNPAMSNFYGLSYFQNTTQGNCDNGNQVNCNCNCGNVNCGNCYNCGAINCANCDSQAWLQTGTNCACTYNCTSYGVSHNCNCACDCSKIVCAKLHDMGLMSANIWAADQAYGRWLREHDRRVYRGYIRWARIVTAWMSGEGPDFMYWVKKPGERAVRQQRAMTEMAYNIGTPWSQHMAYLMGALPEDNFQGRVLMKIGTTISRIVDYIPRRRKSQVKHGPVTVGTIWACLYFSYYTSVAIVKAADVFKRNTNKNLVQEISK